MNIICTRSAEQMQLLAISIVVNPVSSTQAETETINRENAQYDKS